MWIWLMIQVLKLLFLEVKCNTDLEFLFYFKVSHLDFIGNQYNMS